MKTYIAASFPRRDEMRAVLKWLEQQDIEVTSRWLKPEWQDHTDYGDKTEYAVMDIEDVTAAEFVICFTDGERQVTRGGRHTELGVAIAQGKRVYLIGPKEQVFHEHPLVIHVSDSLVAGILAVDNDSPVGKAIYLECMVRSGEINENI